MAEQDTSNDLAQRLRDIALGMNAAANQATLREAAQRIEHHEMPWARLMKQAAGEDGVDSQAFLSRLWKKVEDQKRELAALNEKLRLAQEKQSTGNEPCEQPTVRWLDSLFYGDTETCEVRKSEWIKAKAELIAHRHGLTAEQVATARESLLQSVAEKVRAAQPPGEWRALLMQAYDELPDTSLLREKIMDTVAPVGQVDEHDIEWARTALTKSEGGT